MTAVMLYTSMRLLGRLACALPRRAAMALGRGAGEGLWLLARLLGHGDFVPGHVRAAYPDWPEGRVRSVARHSVRETMASIVELLRMPLWQTPDAPRVAIHGVEHLRTALARDRGAIIVTAHYGNWELLAATLAREVGPMTVLIQPPTQPAFRRLFDELHAHAGVRAHSNVGPASLRPVLTTLASGGLVGLVCDQHGEGSAVTARFLGHEVGVPTGAFLLARRTGASLVPARMVRLPDDTHRLEVETPLVLEEDDARMAQSMMDRFATWIEDRPDLWLWIHDRWAKARRLPREHGPVPALAMALAMPLALALAGNPADARGRPRQVPPPPPPPVVRPAGPPLLAAFPDRIEVRWPSSPGLQGRIALPAPPEAWLPLPDRQALLVHLPRRQELHWVDLSPTSATRFQTTRTYRDETLGGFDLILERVADRVLIGYGRTVVADLGLSDGTWRAGFDRPDQTGHPFRPWSSLPWQGGFLTLEQGQLRVETGRPDPRFRGPETRVIDLPHPVVAFQTLGRDGQVAVLCRPSNGIAALVELSGEQMRTRRILEMPGAPIALGRLGPDSLGVVAGTDLHVVSVAGWSVRSRGVRLWGPVPPLRVHFPLP